MAKQDSTRVHRCAHCNKEFFGRKKKFCTPVCRDEHRKQSKRQHINGDRQSCSECGEWWPTWLFKSAQSNAKCDACARRRQYLRETGRKAVSALPGPVWRTSYIHRRFNQRSASGGHQRCYSCSRLADCEDIRRGQCSDCEKEYRASAEARKRKRVSDRKSRLIKARSEHRINFSTYGDYLRWARKQIRARAFDRLQDVRAQRNAMEALDWYIKEGASDEWVRRWYLNSAKPWTNPRLTEYQKRQLRMECDPEWAAKERLRLRLKSQMRKALKGERLQSYMRSALRNGRGSSIFEKRFGYTLDDLMAHLEKQFTKGMSWDRFFKGDIHIDHIVPKSNFDMSSESDIKACWGLSNLRPLWAQENVEKGAKMTLLL